MRDSPTIDFRERLWPGPWFWLLTAGTVAMVAIAYGAALGPAAGWGIAVAGTALGGWIAFRLAKLVTVSPAGLRAGAAVLPPEAIGAVIALGPEKVALARGPRGDPTAWMVTSPGAAAGAVLVEVDDPTDPHRTWLVASRDPEGLARAIEAARGRLAQ